MCSEHIDELKQDSLRNVKQRHEEHYKVYKTDEERFQNRPRGVSTQEWVFFLDYFKSKDFKVKIQYHIPITLFF